jgi:hypothetical protein
MLTKTSAKSKKVEQHDTELCENQAGRQLMLILIERACQLFCSLRVWAHVTLCFSWRIPSARPRRE